MANFSLVVLRLMGLEKLDPAISPAVERAIGIIFNSIFRNSDLRGRVSADSLGVILPETAADKAAKLTHQLHARIATYLSAWFPEIGTLRFETSSTPSGGVSEADELIARARATARPDQLTPGHPLTWSKEVAKMRQEHRHEEAVAYLLRQVQEHPSRGDLRNRLIRSQLETATGSAGASEQLSLLLMMDGDA